MDWKVWSKGIKGTKEKIGTICVNRLVCDCLLFLASLHAQGKEENYPSHLGNKIAVLILVSLALHKDRSVGMGTSHLEDSQNSDQSIVRGKELPNKERMQRSSSCENRYSSCPISAKRIDLPRISSLREDNGGGGDGSDDCPPASIKAVVNSTSASKFSVGSGFHHPSIYSDTTPLL